MAAPVIPETTSAEPRVVRRDGSTSDFDASKISVAMTKAFLAVEGDEASASSRIHPLVEQLTAEVIGALTRFPAPAVHVEQIQDQVELVLMRGGHHKIARSYVLYREERAKLREAEPAPCAAVDAATWARIETVVGEAVADLEDVSAEPVLAPSRPSTKPSSTRCSCSLSWAHWH
jgi:ribonucleoside-diphosphate reductase alpha chain